MYEIKATSEPRRHTAAKVHFGLAMTLTFDLWSWKPFQQWTVIWRLLAPSFIKLPPL